MRINIIIAVCLIIVMLGSIRSVRRLELDLKYALTWFLSLICMLVIDIFPGFLAWMSELVGIDLPINMVFFVGICFCLFLIFRITVTLSKQEEKEKRLTQQLALLERRVEELEKDEENRG